MASVSVYLKSLCDNTSFISRSNQAALSRKVTMEERKECSHREIHFPSVRSHSLSFSHFPRDLSLSLSVTSRLLYTHRDLSTLCSAVQKRSLLRPLAGPPSLQAPLLALFPYRCPALPRVLPQRSFLALSLALCIPLLLLLLQLASSSSSSSSS